ncbi:caspase family protein [Streptomyces sp. NPDC005963]|uniref:caspase family protein n=1 Tax=Streptomyces sp. NPDC005963 TaxID=3156721 RepID=UPI0033D3B7DC
MAEGPEADGSAPEDDGSAPQDGAEPRRFLIATAVRSLANAPDYDVPELADDVRRMEELFLGDLRYQRGAELGLDPTRGEFIGALRSFARAADRRADDHLVVYLACHGAVTLGSGLHQLMLADTDPADLPHTGLPPTDIARALWEETGLRRVLIFLDACHSGAAADSIIDAAHVARQYAGPRGASPGSEALIVVSSSRRKEETSPGVLTNALVRAVHASSTAGHVPAFLSVNTVLGAMSGDPAIPEHMNLKWDVADASLALPPFLPNPRHVRGTEGRRLDEIDRLIEQNARQDAQRAEELRVHFFPRARGTDVPHDDVWHFTGRHLALRELADWLRPERAAERLTVVTGDPGSGKSALLGLVTVVTDPDYRPAVPRDALALPDDCLPAAGTVHTAVLASHRTTREVLDALAAAAGLVARSAGELITRLQGRTTPLVVIVDAVDEAVDPDALIRDLLGPLTDPSLDLPLRLVLGARRQIVERRLPDALRIDLDEDRYTDPQAVRAYVTKLLTAPASAVAGHPAQQVDGVAEAVAEAAGRSFLVARITALTLARDLELPDPLQLAWRAELPRFPGEAMERDLRQRLGEQTTRARDLLLPLAFAQGAGLPWAGLWPRLASAVSGRPYGDADIAWLRTHAGSYVVEGIENGESVYRIYHRALIEHLREGQDAERVQRAVTDTLIAVAADWAHPYVRRYLPLHGAQGGRLDELVHDASFVLSSDLEQLLAALPALRTPDGLAAGRAVRSVSDALREAPGEPETRAKLRWAAVCHRAERLGASCDASGPMPWRTRWAAWNTEQENWRFTAPELGLDSGAVVLSAQGLAHVSIQNRNETVRWDLGTGVRHDLSPVFQSGPQTALVWGTAEFEVPAMAVIGGSRFDVQLDVQPRDLGVADPHHTLEIRDVDSGNSVIVRIRKPEHGAGGAVVECAVIPELVVLRYADDSIVEWDVPHDLSVSRSTLRQGQPAAPPFAPSAHRCVAVRLPDPCIVLAVDDRVLLCRATGEPTELRPGHTVDCATGVHPHPLGPLLVTGGTDGSVRVSAVASGQPVRTLLAGGPPVAAVSALRVGRQWLVVAVTDNGTLHRFDLDTGRRLGNPRRVGRGGPVRTTTGPLDAHHSVVVVHGSGRGVQMYDVVTGERIGGHVSTGEVTALYELRGEQPAVCVGGRDGLIRVVHSGPTADTVLVPAHGGKVLALGGLDVGGEEEALISVGDDQQVRCWQPRTGDELWTSRITADDRWQGPTAMCAAVHSCPDRTAVVAIGGASGTLLTLRLADGTAVHEAAPQCDTMITAVCAGVVGDRPVTVGATTNGGIHCWDVDGDRWLTHCTPPAPDLTDPTTGDAPTGDPRWITSLALAPDGSGILVAGTEDGTLLRFDLPSGRAHGPAHRGHRTRVTSLAFIDDGQGTTTLVSASDDRAVTDWDIGTGTFVERATVRAVPAVNVLAARAVANGGTHTVLGGDDSGTVRVVWRFWKDPAWRIDDLVEHTWPPAAVCAGPSGQIAIGGMRGDLQLREITTGRLLARLRSVSDRPIRGLAGFRTPAGDRYLASLSSSGIVELWDLASASFREAGRALPTSPAFGELSTLHGPDDVTLLLSMRQGLEIHGHRFSADRSTLPTEGLPSLLPTPTPTTAPTTAPAAAPAPRTGRVYEGVALRWPLVLDGRRLLFVQHEQGDISLHDLDTHQRSRRFRLASDTELVRVVALPDRPEPAVLVCARSRTEVYRMGTVLDSFDETRRVFRRSGLFPQARKALTPECGWPAKSRWGGGFVGVLPGGRSYVSEENGRLYVHPLPGLTGLTGLTGASGQPGEFGDAGESEGERREIVLPFTVRAAALGPAGELVVAAPNGVVLIDPLDRADPAT